MIVSMSMVMSMFVVVMVIMELDEVGLIRQFSDFPISVPPLTVFIAAGHDLSFQESLCERYEGRRRSRSVLTRLTKETQMRLFN